MKHTFTVIRHEFLTTLSKPSFWFMSTLFPVIILVLSFGNQIIGEQAIQESEQVARESAMEVSTTSIGYVDLANIINTIQDNIPPGLLIKYETEAAAQRELESGRLRQYYLVPENFLETGNYILVDKTWQPITSETSASFFRNILLENLAAEEPLGWILFNPTPSIVRHALGDEQPGFADTGVTLQLLPVGAMFILFFVIVTSSSFMLQSVSKEKENRTVEILLVSLRPLELMLGKVIGLGLVALIQMSLWIGGALFTLSRNAEFSDLLSQRLPDGFFVYTFLYFFFGYFLYASIMGALGALAPNTREASQFTFIFILPLLVPLWLNFAFTEDPNGGLAVFLSLFPLTSPAAMLSRLVTVNVPFWQIILSLAGLAITAFLVIMLSGRLFRADTLLSTASLNWKELFRQIGASMKSSSSR